MKVKFKERGLETLADEYGWVHTASRLRGTLNVRALSRATGISLSVASRLYETGEAGPTAQAALLRVSGLRFDDLFEVVEDSTPALAASSKAA